MEAFAERAGRELVATGEQVRKRSAETRGSSRPRRSRSPGSPATACRTRRSARSCSSVPARSSGICARCSPSSASPRAGSSGPRCPKTAPSSGALARLRTLREGLETRSVRRARARARHQGGPGRPRGHGRGTKDATETRHDEPRARSRPEGARWPPKEVTTVKAPPGHGGRWPSITFAAGLGRPRPRRRRRNRGQGRRRGCRPPRRRPPDRDDIDGGAVRGVAAPGGRLRLPGPALRGSPYRQAALATPAAAGRVDGVRDATNFAPSCRRPGGTRSCRRRHQRGLPLPQRRHPGAEPPTASRPVLVWIHGGGFTQDAGSHYDPAKLAAEGIVVVTINYRLGALGFLAHPALASSRAARPGTTG